MGSFEIYKNRVENGVEIDMLTHMAFKGSQEWLNDERKDRDIKKEIF